jgi:hypothetical protein
MEETETGRVGIKKKTGSLINEYALLLVYLPSLPPRRVGAERAVD